MKNIKQIIDAVAVLVGRALRLDPVSWKQAKIEAVRMNEAYAKGGADVEVDLFDAAGNELKVEQTMTPIRFMLDQIFAWVAGVIAFYVAVKIVGATIAVLFKFVILLGVLYAAVKVSDFFFGPAKVADVPAPMNGAEPAAA